MTNISSNPALKVAACILLVLSLAFIGCGGGNGSSSQLSEFNGGTDPDPGNTKSVSLSWNAPTSNVDGSSLIDLAGYKVYYGPGSNNYTQSLDVGSTPGAAISSLSSDTWCFAVSAYDTSGNESDLSEEVCI